MTLGELRAVNSSDRIKVISSYDGRVFAHDFHNERHSFAASVQISRMYLDIATHKNWHNSAYAVMVCYVRDDEWNKAKAGGTE